MRIISRLARILVFNYRYWIKCKGSAIKYMRTKGVRIGRKCQLASGIKGFSSEPWLVEIGDGVSIAPGISFVTHDGSSRLFRDKVSGMNSKWGNRYGTIKIHDNCFIGMNVTLLPDVTIGPNSIVGTGSIVSKSVPPDSVWAGIPAKHICTLDEYIERYKGKMIKVEAVTRENLRKELTSYFWGEER